MKNRRRLTALLLLISLFSCVEPYDMGSQKTEYPQEDFSANKANLLENGGLEEWNMFPYHYDIPTGWYCHNNTNDNGCYQPFRRNTYTKNFCHTQRRCHKKHYRTWHKNNLSQRYTKIYKVFINTKLPFAGFYIASKSCRSRSR